MTKRTRLKIGKMDAAKRQLETAIHLWFFSGDPVSIHTLACAAHQILHDIGGKCGVPAVLREPPGVAPEHMKRIRKLVNKPENFFKHADSDPDALLDFNPEATELFILDAVITYEALTQEAAPILSTFKAWLFILDPRYMKEEDRPKFIEKIDETEIYFQGMPKVEFFRRWHFQLLKASASPLEDNP